MKQQSITPDRAAIRVFGMDLENRTLNDAAETIVGEAMAGVRKRIGFINAHCVNVAAKDPEYRVALKGFDHLYADGSGMLLAARSIGARFTDNVNGTDLFPLICRIAAEQKVSIGLLGASHEVVNRCAMRIQDRFPGLSIGFVHHGYLQPADVARTIEQANQSGCQILFLAMGVPRQEIFIADHGEKLTAPQVLGVGGLFDFYSGLRIRAPYFIRKSGMEWTVRLAQEPRRLGKRYLLGNPVFLLRVLQKRVRGKRYIAEEL